MSEHGIAGVTISGVTAPEAPNILVISAAKIGKSTSTITLFDWPFEGNRPLVLAFDAHGVDVCAARGFGVPHIKIKDRPGATFWDKTKDALQQVEIGFRNRGPKFPYTSIVVDCASTMCEQLFQEIPVATDPRQQYGELLSRATQIYNRLAALGVPVVWHAWLQEAHLETTSSGGGKKTKLIMGGPLILGGFKAKLAGRSEQVLLMTMEKVGVGVAGADEDGNLRQFRTKPHNNIVCDGRFSQYLTDPCPPNLAYVLNQVMTLGGAFEPKDAFSKFAHAPAARSKNGSPSALAP